MLTDQHVRKTTMAKYRTRLAELMQKHGMSRMDIVRAANMSYPTVVNWEKKSLKSIDADKVTTLMKIFNCTQDELVYVVEEDEPTK